MSSLKFAASSNSELMSVSPTVFQREMWPYLASAAGRSLSHSCTAVRRSGRQGQSAQNLLNTWPPPL
eukprot:4437524-Prorocentrum_lima.AAC.2